MAKKKKSEKELLEDYLKQELDKKNIFNHHGNPQGLKGFPDRVIYAHRVYYIELKLGKENDSYYEQTKTQKKWELQIKQTINPYLLISNREEIDDIVALIHRECIKYDIKNHFAFNKDVVETMDE